MEYKIEKNFGDKIIDRIKKVRKNSVESALGEQK